MKKNVFVALLSGTIFGLGLLASGLSDSARVLGAVLFGMGWGIAGYCPGPAIVAVGAALTRLDPSPWIFTSSMIVGMLIHARLLRWFAARAPVDA
jgi:uncharacterized membrane protein YedE/YeeE